MLYNSKENNFLFECVTESYIHASLLWTCIVCWPRWCSHQRRSKAANEKQSTKSSHVRREGNWFLCPMPSVPVHHQCAFGSCCFFCLSELELHHGVGRGLVPAGHFRTHHTAVISTHLPFSSTPVTQHTRYPQQHACHPIHTLPSATRLSLLHSVQLYSAAWLKVIAKCLFPHA